MKSISEYINDNLPNIELYEDKWIYINGNKSSYKITSDGEVISTEYQGHKRKNIYYMKGGKDKDGYRLVVLTLNGRKYTRKVHRLVAEAFIPNPDNKPEVNHKDGNKSNNKIDNLEWNFPSENTHHASENGLRMATNSKESIEYVCVLLSSNNYNIDDISKMSGVDKATIYKILNKKIWVDVSSKYNIDNYDRKKHKTKITIKRITDEQCKNICTDLENNNGTMNDIAIRNNTTLRVVNLIFKRKYHTNISKDYDFSKYKKKVNQFK